MEQGEWITQALALNTRAQFFSHSSQELEKIDEEFQKLILKYDSNFVLLFYYNEFRIAHLAKLPKTRPCVLLGGPLNIFFPNAHSYPLFEFADVMCLTVVNKPYNYKSTIHCAPNTLFVNILRNLPPHFTPDFFLDNQVEQKHFIPYGINLAPFPTVASVCHIFLHKTIEQICELFDLVLPISTSYGDVLKKTCPEKILDFPFGFNWASMDKFVRCVWSKSIDVCLTFDETDSDIYRGKRNKVIELTKKFQEKYKNRFSITIKSKMTPTEYASILQQSRITINVTGVHGPYNYRTVEAMAAGSMIFQFDWKEGILKNYFSEYFIDGVHGVGFNEENFEQKLLYFLEHPAETAKIAREGRKFLSENYSYKKLFANLFEKIKNRKETTPRQISTKKSYYLTDLVYYYQDNESVDLMCYGVLHMMEMVPWIRFNNLMILIGALMERSIAKNLVLSLIPECCLQSDTLTDFSLMSNLYEQAILEAPPEYSWIIQWNFLLLSIEQKQCKKDDLEKMQKVLQKVEVKPFNEQEVMFKYYLISDDYPKYKLESHTSGYIPLNLALMKVQKNSQESALLYRDYALNAVKHFIESCKS